MRRKVLVTAAGITLLALPAAVLAGGGGLIQQEITSDPQQSAWRTGAPVTVNSRQFREIPDMPQGDDVTLDITAPSPIYVSVDLRAGKAKVRMREGGTEQVEPASVLLTRKGVTTATFIVEGDGFENPVIEWKKVGRPRVRASSVVASIIGEID